MLTPTFQNVPGGAVGLERLVLGGVLEVVDVEPALAEPTGQEPDEPVLLGHAEPLGLADHVARGLLVEVADDDARASGTDVLQILEQS